ncbi:hypothetical protein PAXRUDRAFT_20208 [Paxillus rubicundulus Ve08.2h10]|uniref:Uncharacterized protein n=1 Tax=Paxillus rubicundulus Ve08.2h10 TaxID=930991 RepID=A0A0D0DA80_9AGAM|nr:hypothetical protein PAXRUDRAFT_20208 [Paxillus rubicundulus Ve08.2h10]
MQFGRHPDEIKLYLDGHYVSFCEAFWRILQFHMHAEEPAAQNPDMHDVVAQGE